MSDYLPESDSPLRVWALNFSDLISADPAAYGISAGDAAEIAAAVSRYDAAYPLAIEPGTRTRVTVAAKNDARDEMKNVLRLYAQIIKRDPVISGERKVALGLRLDAPRRAEVPAPETAPSCSVLRMMHLQHVLWIADGPLPTRRARPAGVLGAEVFLHIGDHPPANPEAGGIYYALATRAELVVNLPPSEAGKKATYYARWVTRRGRRGPWSTAISATVAA